MTAVDGLFLLRLEHLAKAFEACDHKFVRDGPEAGWCNLCGAQRIASGPWLTPHWRDILLPALLTLPSVRVGACTCEPLERDPSCPEHNRIDEPVREPCCDPNRTLGAPCHCTCSVCMGAPGEKADV
jgi:hypothetical protein